MQEGLIIVWQSLERGIRPTDAIIEARMHDWVRLLGTQIGRGRGPQGEAIEYAKLLPLSRIEGYDEQGIPITLGELLTDDPIPLPGHDPLA